MKELKVLEEKYKLKITCSLESEPLGTAGPIRLAKDIILADNSSNLLFKSGFYLRLNSRKLVLFL